MKELPKIHVNDEKNEKKETIEFEIKSDLVGGNESSKYITKPDQERKIKRINNIIIDKKEIEKAPHPPALKIPKMPQKAPHPPVLPIPEKLTLKMRLHLLRKETTTVAEQKGKQLTKTITQINYFKIIGIVLLIVSFLLITTGIYGKIYLENTYKNIINNFNEENTNELQTFCQTKKYKECKTYIKYIEALENINNKNYNEANKIFKQINTFRKSNNYINYIEALEHMQNYNITEAKQKFVDANILNSKEYIDYINYINKINENNEVNLNEIYILENIINLNYISNYLDSKNLFKEKNYKRIIEILEQTSIIIKPAQEILNEAKYQYAKNMQYEGYIGTAYKLLNEIINYKDSQAILESPIYYVINNWTFTKNTSSIQLSFYKSSNTCFNEIKNGTLIGLPYNEDTTIYEYKIKNNAIYFKDATNEYKPIYIIKNFSKDKLVIMIENQTIELKPR